MGNKPNFDRIRSDTIQKRDKQLEKFIPVFKDILAKASITPEKIDLIIKEDVSTLVHHLNNREITSLQLVAIYGLRAATIGKNICSITQEYFQYALQKAKECDQIRAKTNKNNWTFNDGYDNQKFLPPLFGIPVSIKDNIEMAGTMSTIGLTARANKIYEADCAIITCAKNSGMIPFIKTNLPQIALNFDSSNFLWGRTLNPWNQNKSAGGSSGGQGASIAAKVSPIGIGNDMLGSIRIPAAFNGVVGLLSSPGRLPLMNTTATYHKAFSGMDSVKIVTGPLTQSVEGAALWMKAMTTQSFYEGKHDPYVKLHPFDEKVYNQAANSKKKLRIGYIQNLEMIETTPAANRGLLQVVEFLKSQGHELVEIHIPNEREVLLVPFYEIISQGNMTTFTQMLQGQKLVDEYSNFNKIANMNSYLFKALRFVLQKLQPRVGFVLGACQKLTTHQYLQKVGRFYELRHEWIRYWRNNKLDFVICPGFGVQAPNHGFSKQADLVAAYVYIWNVFAMTSCSLPVTVTREDEQYYESHWEDDFTKAIKKTVSTSAGLPVSVQVVGLPFSEEKVLGLAKKIQKHFQFHQKHPLPNLQP